MLNTFGIRNKKKKKTVNLQTQNSLEEATLESLSVLVLSVKYPQVIAVRIKSPSGVGSFYLLLRRKMKPRKESDVKVRATVNSNVKSQL